MSGLTTNALKLNTVDTMRMNISYAIETEWKTAMSLLLSLLLYTVWNNKMHQSGASVDIEADLCSFGRSVRAKFPRISPYIIPFSSGPG